MKKVLYEAIGGVSCECPGNTLPAFISAVKQGYDSVVFDLDFTQNADFSCKYKDIKPALLTEVLELAGKSGIRVRICNIPYDESSQESLAALVGTYKTPVEFTFDNVHKCAGFATKYPTIRIHYNGIVTSENLSLLAELMPDVSYTVWMTCDSLSDESTMDICRSIRRNAVLGISDVNGKTALEKAQRLGADIISTNGRVKPVINVGVRCDMHTHSESSHDSKCHITDMAQSQIDAGTSFFAVTDHCDIEYCRDSDVVTPVRNSFADAAENRRVFDGRVTVLRGVEIGEGIYFLDETKKVYELEDYDLVISSVHAVRFPHYEMPYSMIDFSMFDDSLLDAYLRAYFDEVLLTLQSLPTDILPHLTCPLRYINGKYSRGIDCHRYKAQIIEILRYAIDHAIALEVNTSTRGGNYNEYMPEEWIIDLFKDMGGYLVTTGSDAHIAENASHDFDVLYGKLSEKGFDNVYYLDKRCLVQCALKQSV